MKLCKVDSKGRITIKKAVEPVAPYYWIESSMDKIILKPVYDKDAWMSAVSEAEKVKLNSFIDKLMQQARKKNGNKTGI